jgi:hypothetical protein
MALIKCHECGQSISEEAKLCPHCGAKPKKSYGGLLLGLIGVAFILSLITQKHTPPADTNTPAAHAETPEETAARKRQLDDEFAKEKPNTLARIKALQKKGEHDEAIKLINHYDGVTDPELSAIAKISSEAIIKADREKAVTKAKYAKMNGTNFCKEVGKTLRTPLAKRNKQKSVPLLEIASEKYDVVAADYSPIESRSPRIGMRWCSLIAAIGEPERINRTMYSSGEHQQWVYGNIGSHVYVYFENGLITAWQD